MASNNKSRIADLDEDLTDEELLNLKANDELPSAGVDADESLPEDDDDADHLDDELEESRLSRKQKLLVFLTATISFFIFTVFFFPLEELIRYQLRGFEKQVAIDFATLDLNLIGKDTVGGFSAQLPNGAGGFSAESIESELSWMDIISYSPEGLVQFENSEFHMEGFAFDAATMDLKLDIDNAMRLLSTSRGRIHLLAGGVKFTQLPLDALPIPISLDELNVRRLNLALNFTNGTIDFQDSSLASDLFTARLTGTGRVGTTLGATVLQAKLCLKPVDDLENKNPELFTVYIMGGGAAGGELCVDISGTISQPQVNIQRTNSFGGLDSTDDPENSDSDPENSETETETETETEAGAPDQEPESPEQNDAPPPGAGG